MTLARDLTIATVAGGLGLLGGWFVASPLGTAPRAAAVPAPHPRPRPADSTQRRVERGPMPCRPVPTPSCDEAITSALTEHRERQKRLATGEVPFPWPADLPASYRHANVDARLTELLGRTSFFGGLDLDCSEFPCLAYIDLPEQSLQDDTTYAMEQVVSMSAELREIWPDLVTRPHVGCSQDTCTTTLHFTPAEHFDDALETRIKARRHAFEYGVED